MKKSASCSFPYVQFAMTYLFFSLFYSFSFILFLFDISFNKSDVTHIVFANHISYNGYIIMKKKEKIMPSKPQKSGIKKFGSEGKTNPVTVTRLFETTTWG